MPISHYELLQCMKQLSERDRQGQDCSGYYMNEKGMCFGFTFTSMQAVLLNDLKTYNKRLDILEEIFRDKKRDLLREIEKVMQMVREKKSLTPEQELILSIPAFFECVAIYFSPIEYSYLFEENEQITTSEFRKGRELSAYLGLVPKQHSSGEKQVLLGISKHGDRYIRQLLIHGGRSSILAAMKKDKNTGLFVKQDAHSQWMRKLTDRVGKNKASVAVANKNARIIVALLKNETDFRAALAH